MNDRAGTANKWQTISKVVTGAGIVIGGITVFSAIPAAKSFFQTQVFEGITVFDSILVIGTIVAIAGAAMYTYNKSEYNCSTRQPLHTETHTPVIHAVFTVSQGMAMGLAFQFTMMMLAYYNTGTGISGLGAIGIAAGSSLFVSALCAALKYGLLYQDEVAIEDEYDRTSFGEWMDGKAGRWKDAIVWDFIAPGVLASAASGFAGYILPKATTGIATIAIESILISGAVLALYSAIRQSRDNGSAAEGFERVT